jgi:hypothetical protein
MGGNNPGCSYKEVALKHERPAWKLKENLFDEYFKIKVFEIPLHLSGSYAKMNFRHQMYGVE